MNIRELIFRKDFDFSVETLRKHEWSILFDNEWKSKAQIDKLEWSNLRLALLRVENLLIRWAKFIIPCIDILPEEFIQEEENENLLSLRLIHGLKINHDLKLQSLRNDLEKSLLRKGMFRKEDQEVPIKINKSRSDVNHSTLIKSKILWSTHEKDQRNEDWILQLWTFQICFQFVQSLKTPRSLTIGCLKKKNKRRSEEQSEVRITVLKSKFILHFQFKLSSFSTNTTKCHNQGLFDLDQQKEKHKRN